MPGAVRHFAIRADNVDRAMAFYTAVFGWSFAPWGPPGFYQITNAGLPGALHARQIPLTGSGLRAFEATVGVDDLEATRAAVIAHGGRPDHDRGPGRQSRRRDEIRRLTADYSERLTSSTVKHSI